MTFTGDLGTIYPYLTLPKFEFTKVNVCLNNIAIVQLILDKNFIIVKQLSFIKNFLIWFYQKSIQQMYGFLMATRNTCLGLSSLGQFVNTYLLKGTSSVWIGKRHFGALATDLQTPLSVIFLAVTWFSSRKRSCNRWCAYFYWCITFNVFHVVHCFSHCEHFSLDKEFGKTSFS